MNGERLSQGHLNLLATCPRKFQHLYLDQLQSPPSPDQQERMDWGNRFHLLMQQQVLGLPVETFLPATDPLQRARENLTAAVPVLARRDTSTTLAAEHARAIAFEGYMLTVVYDLLLADPDGMQIFDWKTYPRPRDQSAIWENWQTRLYLWVLGETGDRAPEQLSMTYWFVGSGDRVESVRIAYDRSRHEDTRQDLTAAIVQLENWRVEYRERGVPFPQVALAMGHCRHCAFALRCQRSPESESPLDLARIREIPLQESELAV